MTYFSLILLLILWFTYLLTKIKQQQQQNQNSQLFLNQKSNLVSLYSPDLLLSHPFPIRLELWHPSCSIYNKSIWTSAKQEAALWIPCIGSGRCFYHFDEVLWSKFYLKAQEQNFCWPDNSASKIVTTDPGRGLWYNMRALSCSHCEIKVETSSV